MPLQSGDQAPDFHLADDEGNDRSLAGLVLYFCPVGRVGTAIA